MTRMQTLESGKLRSKMKQPNRCPLAELTYQWPTPYNCTNCRTWSWWWHPSRSWPVPSACPSSTADTTGAPRSRSRPRFPWSSWTWRGTFSASDASHHHHHPGSCSVASFPRGHTCRCTTRNLPRSRPARRRSALHFPLGRRPPHSKWRGETQESKRKVQVDKR